MGSRRADLGGDAGTAHQTHSLPKEFGGPALLRSQ